MNLAIRVNGVQNRSDDLMFIDLVIEPEFKINFKICKVQCGHKTDFKPNRNT